MAVTSADAIKELTIGGEGRKSTFILTGTSLYVNRQHDTRWPEIAVPLRHIAWAEVADGNLEVSLLARKKKKTSLVLVHITGAVAPAETEAVLEFTQALMAAAYRGVKKNRHILVLVNPHAGPGRGVQIFWKKSEPIFRAARATTDVTFTTHPKHAMEIARDLPLGKYDAVVTMSGDGLVHEVLNGFASHKDPIRALRTPVAPIPVGSGNGLSLNLLGLEDGFDVSAATLNAIKGFPMPTDVFSVTQKDTRVLSFMSQAVGLMAELDLGTEHLRFMGDTRFVYGYVRGVVSRRSCPIKVYIKVAESDKQKMVADLRAARGEAEQRVRTMQPGDTITPLPEPELPEGEHPSRLPPLQRSSTPQGEGWIEIDKPVLYLYAGKGPYVSRDMMQFPVSLPDDGYIDVVVQEPVTRKVMLTFMDGAEKGRAYWLESQLYYKATAYRVEPQSKDSYLSVDGEEYPYEPYEVEVHKGLATLLSPYGCYNVDFEYPKTR